MVTRIRLFLSLLLMVFLPTLYAFGIKAPLQGELVLRFYHIHSLNQRISTKNCMAGLPEGAVRFSSYAQQMQLGKLILLSDFKSTIKKSKLGLQVVHGQAKEQGKTALGKPFTSKLIWIGVGSEKGNAFYGAFSDGYCAGNYTITKSLKR